MEVGVAVVHDTEHSLNNETSIYMLNTENEHYLTIPRHFTEP